MSSTSRSNRAAAGDAGGRTEQKSVAARTDQHQQESYPLDANGIELVLGGLANAVSLVTPRQGLNVYDTPVKYLAVTAGVLFAYYGILAFADIYCFKAPLRGSAAGRRRRLTVARRVRKVATMGAATLAASAAIAGVFVLFGAPVATQQAETLMAAVNVSLLAVTPAILTLRPTAAAWRRALLSVEPHKSVPEKWASALFWCSVAPAWAAAYFVPMDWGRPWQRWPIPIVGGAFLGNLVGLLYVAVRCFVIPAARADFIESEDARRRMAREAGGSHPGGSADLEAAKKEE
ncbi:hypothetical protein GGI11_001718 [Coemansia sp. RSA 2049]|nr:hypothetical protein H4217_001530 [Coemansia sp. RSA 1939]KAJ2522488.1 hypothetical protein GGI11_001718 [Coemansia sp. RSA 2049]KAJ2680689.1 hypothetical protein GGH99_005375 [Coemansia sp. RSA 1285]